MRLALVAVLLVAVAVCVQARCGDGAGDAAAVAAARAQVATDCDCAGAPTHGTFVRCAAGVASVRELAGMLRRECKREITRCAARSTCGKPGFVACCLTRRGTTKCTTRPDATQCTPPRGGTACVGAVSSCCDACDTSPCAPSTTTTTLPVLPCSGGFGPPGCDGTCPAGQTCAANTMTDCGCFPNDVTPCSGSAFPQCGGACQGDTICQAGRVIDGINGSVVTFCLCAAAGSQCADPFPVCGTFPGVCPPGQVCGAFTTGGSAECGCGPP